MSFTMASRLIEAGQNYTGIQCDPCTHDSQLKNQAELICNFISGLNLPVPESEDEYFDAAEGALLIVEDYGVIVRLESQDSAPGPRVDTSVFVLPTLLSGQYGGVSMEVCPLVDTPVSGGDAFWLADRLAEEGLVMDANELDPRNCGYLPIKTERWPNGLPIVLDRSSIVPDPDYEPDTDKSADYSASLQEYNNAIETLYSSLRDAGSQCFLSNGEINHASVVEFWGECEEGVQGGVLKSNLSENVGHGIDHLSRAAKASQTYKERVEGHNPEEYRYGLVPESISASM